jgi:hypothetical protein
MVTTVHYHRVLGCLTRVVTNVCTVHEIALGTEGNQLRQAESTDMQLSRSFISRRARWGDGTEQQMHDQRNGLPRHAEQLSSDQSMPASADLIGRSVPQESRHLIQETLIQ